MYGIFILYNLYMINFKLKYIFTFVIIVFTIQFPNLAFSQNGPDSGGDPKSLKDAGLGNANKPDSGGTKKPDAGGEKKPDAGGSTPTPTIPILRNPLAGLGVGSISDLINVVVRGVVVVGSPLCAIAIIWAGFSYLLAQGDSGKIKKAHDQLWWTIVGTMIVFGASLIAKVVTGTITELLK